MPWEELNSTTFSARYDSSQRSEAAAVLESLEAFREEVGGLFDRVPALAEGRVDVVPVDYVADAIVYLLDRSEVGVFNLVAGRDAPTVDDLISLGEQRWEREIEVVEPGEPTALADGEVYVPYFDMKVVFDDTRARALLEPAGIRPAKLADCFGALIDYAEAARWGKRQITREEARERVAAAAA